MQQPLAVGADTVLQLVVPSDVDTVCDLYIGRGALKLYSWLGPCLHRPGCAQALLLAGPLLPELWLCFFNPLYTYLEYSAGIHGLSLDRLVVGW